MPQAYGLAVYRGISHMLNPVLPGNLGWNYGVLAAAAMFEFYSWRVSYRELRLRKDAHKNIFYEIIGSKDPAIFTVFLEDSAGLVGTALALRGIFLRETFHNPHLDPLASILIGILLAAVALALDPKLISRRLHMSSGLRHRFPRLGGASSTNSE